jgi:hypothetical protein
VIESFRNQLWSGYKTGQGIAPALLEQFQPFKDALDATLSHQAVPGHDISLASSRTALLF